MKKLATCALAVALIFTTLCLPISAVELESTSDKLLADSRVEQVITLEDVISGVRTFEEYQKQQEKQSKGETATLSTTSQFIVDGTYYINNVYFGKYIATASGSVTTTSGLLASLGTSVQWNISYTTSGINEGYVIQPASDSTKYLGISTDTYETEFFSLGALGRIPDECFFDIYIATGGACIIENMLLDGCYLACDSAGTTYLEFEMATSGTAAYDKMRWRVSPIDYLSGKELTSSFTISDMYLTYGNSATPTINKTPSSAIWATASDFVYSTYDPSCLQLNTYTGTFTCTDSGAQKTSYVRATHKVTNQEVTFYIVCNQQGALLLAIRDDDDEDGPHDHAAAFPSVSSSLLACKYSTPSINVQSTVSCSQLLDSMDRPATGIFVSRSHGNVKTEGGQQLYTYLGLSDTPTYAGEYLRSTDITQSNVNFSNLRLAVFVGCYTGAGGIGGNNLPSAANLRGAETAIGFKLETYCSVSNMWTELFFEYLNDGMTVAEAIDKIVNDDDNGFSTRWSDSYIDAYKANNITVSGNNALKLVYGK